MNGKLTAEIKEYAYDLGADLVGVSPIERFSKAPIRMSPQGIMPTATCVVVIGIHHPDLAIELGGEEHPQKIGPYRVQYSMNNKLDYIANRVANRIYDSGYEAVPVACSNIWRYRETPGLDACFAPDMSHIYAATCAGLGQIGWNGLTMTPEYGPWNRFISIVTDAPLEPTPMYYDKTLCDRCGQCIRHCPTDAYRKEVHGTKQIEPEDGHPFVFANKNLWRCAWGEHFDLDLDLPIPEKVDEQALLDIAREHGMRCGEMGACVKYCLPAHLRSPGGEFTSTYIRKRHATAELTLPVHRRVYDEIADYVSRYCVDDVVFMDEAAVDELEAKKTYSGAKGAVAFIVRYTLPKGKKTRMEQLFRHTDGKELSTAIATEGNALYMMERFADLDISRILESWGYNAMCSPGVDLKAYARKAGLDLGEGRADEQVVLGVVLTDAPFVPMCRKGLQQACPNPRKSLSANVAQLLSQEDSDQVAVLPVSRTDALADRLEAIYGGEEVFLSRDKNGRMMPYDAEIQKTACHALHGEDYVLGAKSVILFSRHFPKTVVRSSMKEPAYTPGPYLFEVYSTAFELGYTGLKVCKYLSSLGYKAVMSCDLTGFGGNVASPRGQLPDAFCNSLEAVEAGLGTLAENGVCYTEEHGFSQRFMAIITDAPMDVFCSANRIPDIEAECRDCGACAKACPACAMDDRCTGIVLNGKTFRFRRVDKNRCDWSKRYALCGEGGSKYLSSTTEVPLPEQITAENLGEALGETDMVLKTRSGTAQRCVVDCKLANKL